MDKLMKEGRDFVKSNRFEIFSQKMKSDQSLGIPQPPLEKPYDQSMAIIKLLDHKKERLQERDIIKLLESRESRRLYADKAITLEQLSFLLWATQGIKSIMGNNYATKRPVPSAGARHPFETYLWIKRVEGLETGIYRYLALEHKLLLIKRGDFTREMTEAAMGQKFVGDCACTFVWAATPYRGEWRYHIGSHKTMLLDAGHICQNLYLACEAEGLGTCAIAAYFQKETDETLGLDGENEFSVYMAPVGVLK